MPVETTLENLTKAELYQRAQKADIPGRSQMDRAELIAALANGTPGHPNRTEPSTTQRSIWSGAITFGLITIPVGLYTAIEDRDIAFRLRSGKDRSRVQYKRVSTKTGREVEWDDIVKGYEYENGKFVVFTQEELEQIPVESLRVVDIVQFVERSAIDPLYFDRSYYVAPDKTAVKAYKLFLDALAESDRVAIGKITLRRGRGRSSSWRRRPPLSSRMAASTGRVKVPSLISEPAGLPRLSSVPTRSRASSAI